MIGVYALGKCQRLITLLRAQGYDRPIWLHGALMEICKLYRSWGVALGELRHLKPEDKKGLAGEIVMAPPGTIADRWARGLPDPVVGFASGWMRVRQRAPPAWRGTAPDHLRPCPTGTS